MEKTERDAALALTLREKFVYVTTLDEGFPETRVMFNLLSQRAKALSYGDGKVPRDFASYLATNTSSRKVRQIRADNRVCLYYSDNDKYEGCMVRGRVAEVTDPKIIAAIWTDDWDMYYYGGRDGGDFTLMAFVPEHIQYYHGLKVTSIDA